MATIVWVWLRNFSQSGGYTPLAASFQFASLQEEGEDDNVDKEKSELFKSLLEWNTFILMMSTFQLKV